MPVTTEVRVRYAETDQMGVVYYANYLVWFEVGRVELLRALGFSYRQLEAEHGCILPVIEATCRYRASARYDDQILIETRPALLRGSVLKFAYQIFRKPNQEVKERELLAEGQTVHVVCDSQMRKKHLPPHYAAVLRAQMDSDQGS
jgi:acyl-CoA thioester hydrolase